MTGEPTQPEARFEGQNRWQELDFGDFRCPCGRLLVRRSAEGIQLKCPRCKRVATFRFQANDLIDDTHTPEARDRAVQRPDPQGKEEDGM